MVGELTGPNGKTTTIILLNCFLKLYLSTYKLVQVSSEKFSECVCRGLWLMEKLTTGPRAESKWWCST